MHTIVNIIQNKLAEISALKYISEDWGQLNYYDKDIPVQWPCCLLDINSGTFSETSSTQQGTLQIALNIANIRLSPNSLKASSKQKNDSWEVLQIVSDIHQLINRYRPHQQHGRLIRTSIRKIKRQDAIKQYEVIYTLAVNDI